MPLLKKLHYLNAIDIFDKSDSYCSHFAYSGFAKLKDLIFKNEVMTPTAYPQMAKSAFGMKYIKFEDNLYFLSEVYENILPKNISLTLANRFNQFLDKLLSQSNDKLYRMNTLNITEFNNIVYEQNKTEKPVKNVSLTKYFNDIVQKYSDKIAAIDEFKSINYFELDKKSNQLARLLENQKTKKNDIIAILIDNRIEMLIAILAVLKIGAVYLPISPDTPKERIDYILKDSNAKKLLSTKKLENGNFKNIDFIDLEEIDYTNLNSNELPFENSNNSPAYIIYTSGSTGNPKGVLVNQSSVVNLIECCIHKFNLTNEDRISKYSSFSFDASVIEIFSSLMSGACLYFIPNQIKFDIYKLNHFFNENNITFSFLTTKFAEIFMNLDNRSLKNLLLGGEKLKYFKKTSYNITNAYGPTEATVLATLQDIEIDSDNIPIGKPIQNAKIYILDNELNPRNYSMEGEIYIGGEILAQSYLNQNKLTESKFIPNPFQTEKEKELGFNSKLYRTGDIGKKLESGEILISGRTDFQVKIYGYRIELNEIEQQILKYANITNVTIKAFNDKQDHKYLCAYFEAKENIEIEILKKHLENHLPTYMIPKFFVQLEKMPINYNGKVDLKSLKEPDMKLAKTNQYIAPSTQIEEMISQKFSEILCCENISIHDDFFLLGGNSIKSILLLSKLQEHFILDLSQIYSNKTVYNLANNIKLKGI
jgi:amino acid adenylation domain-containing protein